MNDGRLVLLVYRILEYRIAVLASVPFEKWGAGSIPRRRRRRRAPEGRPWFEELVGRQNGEFQLLFFFVRLLGRSTHAAIKLNHHRPWW